MLIFVFPRRKTYQQKSIYLLGLIVVMFINYSISRRVHQGTFDLTLSMEKADVFWTESASPYHPGASGKKRSSSHAVSFVLFGILSLPDVMNRPVRSFFTPWAWKIVNRGELNANANKNTENCLCGRFAYVVGVHCS